MSLKEAIEKEPIPFALPRKKRSNKNRNKKLVDVDALKQVLNEALNKEDTKEDASGQKKKQAGILRPGE